MDKRVFGSVETELQRVAMDLHDGPCSSLSGIACMANSLEDELQKQGSEESARAGEIARLLRESIAKIRAIIRARLFDADVAVNNRPEGGVEVRCRFRALE